MYDAFLLKKNVQTKSLEDVISAGLEPSSLREKRGKNPAQHTTRAHDPTLPLPRLSYHVAGSELSRLPQQIRRHHDAEPPSNVIAYSCEEIAKTGVMICAESLVIVTGE